MKERLYYLLIFIMPLCTIHAQENLSKVDYKLGIGGGLMGLGDGLVMSIENEVSYKFTPYISASCFVNLGQGGYIDNAKPLPNQSQGNYFLGGVNLLFSPFKNNKINNFKIGGGAGYYHGSNTYISQWDSKGNYVIDVVNDRNIGFNIVIENDYAINEKFLIGAKLYTNGVRSGANITGALIRLGIML
ncbi:MAG: hypothetical protein J5I52_03650 [Saprospiraceae bacterium]|nr:MAG: hypothetical protein UZ09_BCD002002537 [Bacteroidetes bacterium OLB9]MCO6463223.1 hypothetical protein [Saprospiraceae bacterium]